MTKVEFDQLKREVDDAHAEADRAQGALDQLTRRLKEDFDVEDLREAKELLSTLEAKQQKAQLTFDKLVKAYERNWKGSEAT